MRRERDGAPCESHSKPGTKMVHPEPCKRTKKAAAAIYGWDRPLLTFIYPGFEQVAQVKKLNAPC